MPASLTTKGEVRPSRLPKGTIQAFWVEKGSLNDSF